MSAITFFIIGNTHYDPGYPALITQTIAKLNHAGIKIIYTSEGELKPKSLKDKIQELEQLRAIISENLSKLLKAAKINAPNIDAINNIKQFLDLCNDPQVKKYITTESSLEHYRTNFSTYNYFKNKLNLMKFLQSQSIPIFHIDNSVEKSIVLNDNNRDSEQQKLVLKETEQPRTDCMVNELLKLIPTLEKTGGIIFAEVGFVHMHRLMAKLSKKLNDSAYAAKINFKVDGGMILPDSLDYLTQDARETFLPALVFERNLKNTDDSILQMYYQKNPMTQWFWRNDNNEYFCNELDNKIKEIIKTHLESFKMGLKSNKTEPKVLFSINNKSNFSKLSNLLDISNMLSMPSTSNKNDRNTLTRLHRNTLFD